MNTAIFRNTNHGKELLCSKCGRVIKTEKDFDTMTKFAADGVVTLLPQYCVKHQYMNMVGNEKRREKLRRGIREKLREGIMRKNILDIDITRPNQELVIMRGVSGSGKSTKARTLVGEGIIHSTDTLIENTGDYNGFFKKMIETKNFSALSKMHNQNYKNVVESLKNGVSPVVVDNTHIKAWEAKKCVEAALKLGLNEDNIKIVDVGTSGLSAEILAERNTHGVPLDKIKKMLSSHRGVGPLTIKKILEAELPKSNKVLYSAVVLDNESRTKLIQAFASKLPDGWKPIAHHMTIVFGKGLDDKSEVGKEVELTVTKLGVSDMAMAVRVVGYPSSNAIPHITLAVNAKEGGKPVMSNNITNWGTVDLGYTLKLYGIVTEITPNTVT